MAAKKKVTADRTVNYGAMHKNLKSMTEKDLLNAIQQEVDRDQPRPDMLRRLAGRLNKVRGSRVMATVMGMLSAKGKRDVNAALVSDR